MTPTTLILRTAGTNCDRELAYAFELAGAKAETLHLHKLIDDPARIEAFDLIGIPGGFSYGDDIAAGRIFANRLRHRLYEPLLAAIDRGTPIIGICNGFQVLVKLGLLPDPHAGGQLATLADNRGGRFLDRWSPLVVDAGSRCIWTKGLKEFDLPIAHAEGRFVPADEQVLTAMRDQGQVALRYAPEQNPNGSVDDIAGICDPTGLVLGLMPHPERYVTASHHPQWTRQRASGEPAGLAFFRNAVEHVRSRSAAPAG
ncbi:MAG: phosphoribosylformylglycinamidine synthase I [Phycisphaeraceae bacterium]